MIGVMPTTRICPADRIQRRAVDQAGRVGNRGAVRALELGRDRTARKGTLPPRTQSCHATIPGRIVLVKHLSRMYAGHAEVESVAILGQPVAALHENAELKRVIEAGRWIGVTSAADGRQVCAAELRQEIASSTQAGPQGRQRRQTKQPAVPGLRGGNVPINAAATNHFTIDACDTNFIYNSRSRFTFDLGCFASTIPD